MDSQTFYPGLNGGRGLVFPYRMSRSNSPNNYNITWKGKWFTCRNVEIRKHCPIGLLGIEATTTDYNASFKIVLGSKYLKYDINSIRILTDIGSSFYKIKPKGIDSSKYTITNFKDEGYIKIDFKEKHNIILLIKYTKSSNK